MSFHMSGNNCYNKVFMLMYVVMIHPLALPLLTLALLPSFFLPSSLPSCLPACPPSFLTLSPFLPCFLCVHLPAFLPDPLSLSSSLFLRVYLPAILLDLLSIASLLPPSFLRFYFLPSFLVSFVPTYLPSSLTLSPFLPFSLLPSFPSICLFACLTSLLSPPQTSFHLPPRYFSPCFVLLNINTLIIILTFCLL